MVAPTRVDEESPGEPVNPETAQAGLAAEGPPEEETAEEAGLAAAVPTKA